MAKATSMMCENLGIKRITSSSYAPWQNGQVERFHRFLGAALSIYASECKKDWDKWVDCILFTYRVSVHPQTGESPYRIIYNRDPTLGMDLVTAFPQHDVDNRTSEEISDNLLQWFKLISLKQTALAQQQLRQKNLTEKRVPYKFKKGDWVLLYEPPVTHTTASRTWKVPRKFQDVLSGPHQIKGTGSNEKGEWRIWHSRRGEAISVHVSRLVLYNPWSEEVLDTAEGSMVPGHDIRNGALRRDPHALEGEEQKVEFRDGDDVHVGELVAITVEKDEVHKIPIMIVKLSDLSEERTRCADSKEYRHLEGHIYGNTRSDIQGVFRPGWVDPKDNRPYFSVKPNHYTHPKYTSSVSHGAGSLLTYSIVLAGFEFNTADKLPNDVVTALKASPWVDWGEG